MKIIDNFLPKNTFKDIQETFMSNNFPYFFKDKVSSNKDEKIDFYFNHLLYGNNKINSAFFNKVEPIIKKLNILFLNRIKINCYTRDQKLIRHNEHKDMSISHNAAILSLNTCNGGTYIKDKFINSVENRMLLFDGSIPHSSTNCTDKQARFNINFNWR